MGSEHGPGASGKVRFLAARDERVVLLSPVICLLLALLIWCLNQSGSDTLAQTLTSLFIIVIFIDLFHVALTFALLLGSPQINVWSRSEKMKGKSGFFKGLKPPARLTFVAGIWAVIFVTFNFAGFSKAIHGLALTWLIFEILGPSHHTISQIKGISLSFGRKLQSEFQFSEEELKRAEQVEMSEKFLFRLMMCSEVLFWIPLFLAGYFSEFGQFFNYSYIGAALLFLSAMALLFNASRYPHQKASNKMAYLFRVMLYPMKAINIPAAVLTAKASHAIEYYALIRKLLSSSQPDRQGKIRIAMILFVFALAIVIPLVLGWSSVIEYRSNSELSGFIGFFVLISFVIRFSHFYLDSIIFKMSDTYTRQTVLPLIIENR